MNDPQNVFESSQYHSALKKQTEMDLAERGKSSVLSHATLFIFFIVATPMYQQHRLLTCILGFFLLVLTILRLILSYKRKRITENYPRLWRILLTIAIIGQALLWLTLIVNVTSFYNFHWITLFLMIIIAGIAAGSTTSLNPSLLLANIYVISLITPFFVWGLYARTAETIPFAIIAANYVIFLIIFNKQHHKWYIESFKNSYLLQIQTEELKKARKIAEESARSKSQFLANMSHEIRTPINGIIGFLTLALDMNLDQELREYLNTINNCSETLLSLINDILDLSKIEADKIDLESLSFNLEDLVYNICDMVRTKIDISQVELIVETDDNLYANVNGDPTRIRQVLLNLMSNSVKFTHQGQITLKVEPINETEETISIRFSVVDTGIGMTPGQMEKIFDPFIQADGGTTRKYGGTGLGLPISRKLVNLLGGDLQFNSELNAGTTFHFDICFSKVASADAGKPVKQITAAHKKLCFIIEDNSSAAELLKKTVQKTGMHCRVFSSTDAALKESYKAVDLILLDLYMPATETDGFTFFSLLKKKKDTDLIPVIAITADIRSETMDRINAFGFAGYLFKPVRRSSLITMINRVFSGTLPDTPATGSTRKALTESDVTIAGPVSFHILIVEDNKINQTLAEKMITKMGNFVDTADDGEIAVRMVRETKYDLIFMDMQMPNLNGVDATKLIRTFNKNIPIIAMTANVFESDRIACMDAGMNDFIAKPIKRETLRKKIIKHCDYQFGNTPQGQDVRVLIVDDAPITKKVIEKNIFKYFPAWTVKTASNGIEASAMLGSFSPDIVITDIIMPRMDGIALIDFIKTSPLYSDIKLIVITCVPHNDPVIQQVRAYGDIPVESKPCRFQTLKNHMANHILDKHL